MNNQEQIEETAFQLYQGNFQLAEKLIKTFGLEKKFIKNNSFLFGLKSFWFDKKEKDGTTTRLVFSIQGEQRECFFAYNLDKHLSHQGSTEFSKNLSWKEIKEFINE